MSGRQEGKSKMLQIDGHTRLCGLMGNPVGHTMSPVIHNTLAELENRNLVYVPFLVEKGTVRQAVEGAYALNVLGMNVTVPYKTQVISCLDEIDDMAERIGAVNTLVRTEKGFKGYNTDMMGLYKAMCSENIRLQGAEVIVLGAGGAARAVAFLCVSKGAAAVYMLNRTYEKAKQAADEVNLSFQKNTVLPMDMNGYKRLADDRKYLAIQATSVGLYPNVRDAVILEKDFYDKIHTGVDLIYKPSETKFMSLVRESGGQAYHGLKMLLYQGVIAYELWNGTVVSKEAAMLVYDKMKEAVK